MRNDNYIDIIRTQNFYLLSPHILITVTIKYVTSKLPIDSSSIFASTTLAINKFLFVEQLGFY